MIEIKDKHTCCGCEACVQVCPGKCISFREDEQGFGYPSVDLNECINCGLCERVCPVINISEKKNRLKVYAAVNPNLEIRLQSSSGGVFTTIAEAVIDAGGVVFGARFDKDWNVVHDFAESKEGIEFFRGSKYVQSRIGNSYLQVREFLKTGRKVLFSGTSCQIAGLLKFLRRRYDNLLTVDVVCHGVPSPLVWREYLRNVLSQNGTAVKNTGSESLSDVQTISGVSFRDKKYGWKKYDFVIQGTVSQASTLYRNTVCGQFLHQTELLREEFGKNIFMNLFLRDLDLRPSCYVCPAKAGRCGSDITIADYWGIGNNHPEKDDDMGVSLVLVNSDSGLEWFDKLNVDKIETPYEDAFAGNHSIEVSAHENKLVAPFWANFSENGIKGARKILKRFEPSLLHRFLSRVYHCILKR